MSGFPGTSNFQPVKAARTENCGASDSISAELCEERTQGALLKQPAPALLPSAPRLGIIRAPPTTRGVRHSRRSLTSRPKRHQKYVTTRSACRTPFPRHLWVRPRVRRRSARIAHELPSDECGSRAPGIESLQLRTICRVPGARPRGFEPLPFGSVDRRLAPVFGFVEPREVNQLARNSPEPLRPPGEQLSSGLPALVIRTARYRDPGDPASDPPAACDVATARGAGRHAGRDGRGTARGSIATPTAVRQCFFLGFLTTRCTTLDGHFETGGSCHALVVPSS